MAQFQPCLAFTLAREGGFSNDVRDPGGPTKYGITRATLSRWFKRAASVADVQNLTEAVAGQIYHAWYWLTVNGDSLPGGVDLITFDAGVNTGEHTAAVQLQEVIGLTGDDLDGQIGAETLAVLSTRSAQDVIESLAIAQEAYYRSLANFSEYGNGWLNRLALRRQAALAMIGC